MLLKRGAACRTRKKLGGTGSASRARQGRRACVEYRGPGQAGKVIDLLKRSLELEEEERQESRGAGGSCRLCRRAKRRHASVRSNWHLSGRYVVLFEIDEYASTEP